jgi:hypothetical protein
MTATRRRVRFLRILVGAGLVQPNLYGVKGVVLQRVDVGGGTVGADKDDEKGEEEEGSALHAWKKDGGSRGEEEQARSGKQGEEVEGVVRTVPVL